MDPLGIIFALPTLHQKYPLWDHMGLGQTWSGTTHRRHCLHHPFWNILEVIDIELTYIYVYIYIYKNYILSYSQNWNGPPIRQGSRLNSPCHRQGNTEGSAGRSHSKLFRFSRKAAVLFRRWMEISTHGKNPWGLGDWTNDYHHQKNVTFLEETCSNKPILGQIPNKY